MSAHQYLFRPQPTPAVAIDGEGALFPIRRIFCVGLNYAAHAREMARTRRRAAFLLHQAG